MTPGRQVGREGGWGYQDPEDIKESEALLMLDPARAPNTVFPFLLSPSCVLEDIYCFNVHSTPKALWDEMGLLQSQTLGRTSDSGF